MISLIGFSALCLSTIFSCIVLIPKSILQIKIKYFLFFIRSATFLICASFISLILAYVTSDFSNFNVFQKLEEGLEIDYNQYERIHRKQITESIQKPSEEFIIEKIGTEGVRLGARYYKWQS